MDKTGIMTCLNKPFTCSSALCWPDDAVSQFVTYFEKCLK